MNNNSDWRDAALEALRGFLRTYGPKPFRALDARTWISAHTDLPEPVDLRSWGGVYNRAKREGMVERLGFARVDYDAGTSACVVWRAAN